MVTGRRGGGGWTVARRAAARVITYHGLSLSCQTQTLACALTGTRGTDVTGASENNPSPLSTVTCIYNN